MNQEHPNVKETLSMSDRIQKVAPSEDLMAKLRAIPSNVKQTYDKVPKKVVWAVAASIAVLVFLNVFSLREYNEKKSVQETNQTEAYFSYLKQL